MGFYIQAPTNLGKAKFLCDSMGGKIIKCPNSYHDIPEDKGLVCVVSNGAFEAAGFCFDEKEFKAFSEPDDPRRKTWILMNRERAETASHYAAKS